MKSSPLMWMKKGMKKNWKKKRRIGEREQTRRDKTLIISVSLQFCLGFFFLRWIGGSNVVESSVECTILGIIGLMKCSLNQNGVECTILGIRVAVLSKVVLSVRFWVTLVSCTVVWTKMVLTARFLGYN